MKRKLLIGLCSFCVLLALAVILSSRFQSGVVIGVERGGIHVYATLFQGSFGFRVDRSDASLPLDWHCRYVKELDLSHGSLLPISNHNLLGVSVYKLYNGKSQFWNNTPYVNYRDYAYVISFNPIISVIGLAGLFFLIRWRIKPSEPDSAPPTGFPVVA